MPENEASRDRQGKRRVADVRAFGRTPDASERIVGSSRQNTYMASNTKPVVVRIVKMAEQEYKERRKHIDTSLAQRGFHIDLSTLTGEGDGDDIAVASTAADIWFSEIERNLVSIEQRAPRIAALRDKNEELLAQIEAAL